nr:hypothetical protein [Achromobacter ruhlandii]
MGLYFLSYDLRKARNYQPLYDELERFGATRPLESVWSFEHTGATTAALREHFKQFIDADDGLIVIKAKAWAGSKLDGTPPTPASWD